MGRPGCGLRRAGFDRAPAATRCSCTWCWPGTIEPTNVVFAALAERSFVEDRTGWSIRKIVRPAAGAAPSRSAPEPANAPPKTQPLPTSTARSRRSTRSVVRTNLSQVGWAGVLRGRSKILSVHTGLRAAAAKDEVTRIFLA